MSLVELAYAAEEKLEQFQQGFKMVSDIILGTTPREVINTCINTLRHNPKVNKFGIVDKIILARHGYNVKREEEYIDTRPKV